MISITCRYFGYFLFSRLLTPRKWFGGKRTCCPNVTLYTSPNPLPGTNQLGPCWLNYDDDSTSSSCRSHHSPYTRKQMDVGSRHYLDHSRHDIWFHVCPNSRYALSHCRRYYDPWLSKSSWSGSLHGCLKMFDFLAIVILVSDRIYRFPPFFRLSRPYPRSPSSTQQKLSETCHISQHHHHSYPLLSFD